METHTEAQRPGNGQLIFVPHKDTIRLLEVYVKRSLSVNDGTEVNRKARRKDKWVTMPRKQRRHSSDPSLHLSDGFNDGEIGVFSAVEPAADQPEVRLEESEKPTKKSKKNKKKPSLWKSFLGIFSRNSSDERDEEQDSPSEIPMASSGDEASDVMTTCLPTTPAISQKRKSFRRKSIKRRLSRRLSLTRPNRIVKDLIPADITRVEAIVSVAPTYQYYEKVSEVLEKIIDEERKKEEVEPLTDEEVIDRIIALTKQEGDAIEYKLKDNPTLSNFFQGMSYSSFQKLADAYLETEASPTHNPPTVLPTAPELVKLAFTLDFTARVARLSKQNIGHITGLGNRYLEDRFEYTQACSDHPVSDTDD
ncbi:uncharacterized protein LOC119498572 [Sebastes umbrosus]|uniref:uncharacterized protein LOC119498572 n=1 Tax=Sebastes umbrosus TaxID=72105 RepID=UPI00189FBB4C|nr:uncharacterized protein LOC119498572 [Sebastes umbrosus]